MTDLSFIRWLVDVVPNLYQRYIVNLKMIHCGKEKGAKFDSYPSHNALDLLPFPSRTSSFWRAMIYLIPTVIASYLFCLFSGFQCSSSSQQPRDNQSAGACLTPHASHLIHLPRNIMTPSLTDCLWTMAICFTFCNYLRNTYLTDYTAHLC